MNDQYGSSEPTVIRSLAVTTDDLVTALEATERAGRPVILRVTPPFYGRMRARIHVAGGESTDYIDPKPLHIEPSLFVEDEAPPYPEVDETQPEPYDVEVHHDQHSKAISEWRASVRTYLRDTVTVQTPAGPHEVRVRYLG